MRCPHCGQSLVPPPRPLTPKERYALLIIQEFVEDHGVPPTRERLAAELGLASKSGAQRYVDMLIEKGWIRRTVGRGRYSLVLLYRLPPLEEPEVEVTDAGREALRRAGCAVRAPKVRR